MIQNIFVFLNKVNKDKRQDNLFAVNYTHTKTIEGSDFISAFVITYISIFPTDVSTVHLHNNDHCSDRLAKLAVEINRRAR